MAQVFDKQTLEFIEDIVSSFSNGNMMCRTSVIVSIDKSKDRITFSYLIGSSKILSSNNLDKAIILILNVIFLEDFFIW